MNILSALIEAQTEEEVILIMRKAMQVLSDNQKSKLEMICKNRIASINRNKKVFKLCFKEYCNN